MFSGDKLLRIPGPTPVPDRIVRAISRPMVGHRSSGFTSLLHRVTGGLKELFGTAGEVFILAGSGTAAMESAVTNLINPGEPAVVASGGKFGERWIELVQAFGGVVVAAEYPYGQGLEADRLAEILDQNPDARVVFATHNESSTAVMNDLEALARVARSRDRILVVDAVSSLGGAPLEMDAWGVDVVVTGSQKCLMLPPGLAFVGVGERARAKAEEAKGSRYYFDWRRYKKSAATNQTPFTPAVSLLFGLEESLKMLAEEGAEARFARHRLMREMIRAGLAALGFPLFVEDRWASPTLTAARGGDIDVEALRKALRAETGLAVSGGQGELKGEIFRIGHMGAATPLDMVTILGAIEYALARMGRQGPRGAGVGAAMEVWASWR